MKTFSGTGIMVTNILQDVSCLTWTVWGSEIIVAKKLISVEGIGSTSGSKYVAELNFRGLAVRNIQEVPESALSTSRSVFWGISRANFYNFFCGRIYEIKFWEIILIPSRIMFPQGNVLFLSIL